MGGGGKTGTTTQQVTIPPAVLAHYNQSWRMARDAARRPFERYTGEFVAPINERQTAAMRGIDASQGMAQPYYNRAGEMITGSSGPVGLGGIGQTEINQFLNPYTQNVVETTQRAQEQANQQQYQQLYGNAITQGAFGGDRSGIGAANLAYQQNLANQQQIAELYRQGYGQALEAAQTQQARDYAARAADRQALLQAGQQYAGLGAQAQESALQGLQAQLGAGTLEQQTRQALDTAQLQQFLQEKGYPFQVAQFLSNIALGLGTASGSTTTTTQPYSFFSDERMKEDIRPVGKTFDGQNIYSYRYKGEPATRMGLLAQEVEERHPEAVGEAGGMKTVDYDAATRDAADRGRYYQGGLAAEGGAVHPQMAGLGYARGGYAVGGYPVGDLSALIESHRGMYGDFGAGMNDAAGGPYAGLGGPYGAELGAMAQHQLMLPGEAPKLPEPELKGLMSYADQAADIYSKLKPASGGNEEQQQVTQQKASNATAPNAPVTPVETQPLNTPLPPAPPKTSTSTFSLTDPTTWARGGLVGYAHGGGVGYAGGGALPYSTENSYVPQSILEPMKPPEPPKPASAPGQGTSDFGNLLGMAGSMAGIYAALSDRRMKEDIRPVGKTFDGQTVYSYRYKGEPGVQMGLMAQEVERRHPDAVAHDHRGLKMVNYDRATADAAERGKFYAGGLARSGYQVGGTPTDEELQQRIEADAPIGFGSAVENVFEREGRGLVPDDAGRGPTKYGLNAQANPNVDIPNLTEPEARRIYREEYWNPVVKPEMNPAMQNIAFDTAVLMGQPTAQGLIAQSGNDPAKLLDLRDERLRKMAENPRLAPHLEGWLNRSQGLANQFQLAREANASPTALPSFVQPEQERAGLNRADLQAFLSGGERGAAPGEERDFFDRAGDWFQRNKTWVIPIAKGLATMASSPSRYLGSAILQGVGGGAQAYQDLLESQANIDKTYADIATPQKGFMRTVNPDGTYSYEPAYKAIKGQKFAIDPRDRRSVADVVVGGGAGGAGGAGDAGRYPMLSPDAQALAKQNVDTALVSYTMGGQPEPDFYTPVQIEADAARNETPGMMSLAKSIVSVPTDSTFLMSGPGAPALTAFAGMLNSAAARMGFTRPDNPAPFNPEVIANKELMNKQLALMQSNLAAGADTQNFEKFAQMARTLPSDINSRLGQGKIMAELLVSQRQPLDKGAYFRNFRDFALNQEGGQVVANQTGRGANDEFRKTFTPEQYVQEKAALAKAFNTTLPGPNGTPITYFEYMANYGNQLPDDIKEDIAKKLGAPGIWRYFGS